MMTENNQLSAHQSVPNTHRAPRPAGQTAALLQQTPPAKLLSQPASAQCLQQWRRLAWASAALAPNIFSLAPDNSTSEEIMITVH